MAAIEVLMQKGSLIGGGETDELKTKARDLFEQGNRKLILDLSGVTYINSTGIGALVTIWTMYSGGKGKIKYVLSTEIKNIFMTTKLTSVFEIADTHDEAVQSLQ